MDHKFKHPWKDHQCTIWYCNARGNDHRCQWWSFPRALQYHIVHWCERIFNKKIKKNKEKKNLVKKKNSCEKFAQPPEK